MDKTKVTKDLENKTLIIERIFDAPKEKVWRAYADKDTFEKWWGPEGWQTSTKEFSLAPGGHIHYCMECTDKNQDDWYGQRSWGLMNIETVDQPDSFTATDYFSDADGNKNPDMPSQKFTVQLVTEGNKTRLVTRSITATVEQLEELIKTGMIEGFSSQLNRLEQLLA